MVRPHLRNALITPLTKWYNSRMKAAIITIGDEILLGQILDTNSQFIAWELTQLGAETVEMRSVGDTRA